jgi:hypothetical protein
MFLFCFRRDLIVLMVRCNGGVEARGGVGVGLGY